MQFKIYGLFLSLVVSNTFAATTIVSPEEIVVLALNGQEINSGLLKRQKSYKVDAGHLTLSVRYQQYFEQKNGDHDILKSGVVTLETPSLKDNQTYRLSLVNAPKDFNQAKQYAEQPIIALMDENNQLISQQQGAKNQTYSWLSGGLFGGKTQDLQTENNKQSKELDSQMATASQTKLGSNTLIELWKQSNLKERQAFMIWLTNHQ